MIIIIKKRWLISALIVGLLMFFLISLTHITIGVFNSRNLCTIVIDPGHGGIDGGAVSSDSSILESHVNLEIALKLKKLFEESGCRVIMTRQKDVGLYSEGETSIRSKKMEDLVNRNNIMNHERVDYSIMLHLNSFPDSSIYGAQCFYPRNCPKSQLLAEKIQESFLQGIDDGNHRKSKVKDDILLLKNPKSPRVLIECGFLSNPREAKLLAEQSYQRLLANCIYKGFFEFLDSINEGKIGVEYIVSMAGKEKEDLWITCE
ncbi:MAG: N-acetylmuramoyl-L-alanine amidase [Peptostreptococcales bacterium]